MPFSDLKHVRETSGLSQEAFAARVGVKKSTVSRWESGERFPSGRAYERAVSLFPSLRERATVLIAETRTEK